MQKDNKEPVSYTEERTTSFSLRLLPSQRDRIEQVYMHSNFKSKQTLVEHLLMPAIEEFAKKLGL